MTYKKSTFCLLACLVTLWLCSVQVNAAGFRLPNQSAFATARGNAFVATADDSSAVYYNAAGLTQLSRNELQLGVYSVDFNVDFEQAGSTYTNQNEWQFVPQVFYAHKFENFTAGVGLYAPFGLGNEWGDNSPFTSLTTDATIRYVTLSPVAAYQVNDQLSIGGGLTLNHAKAQIEQGVGLFPNDRIDFSGSDFGVGWTLSAMWSPSESHQFGVNYRSAASHDLEGDSTVSFVPEASDSRFSLDIPDLLSLGYSYRPNQNWNFEVDLEWGGWSRLGSPALENTALGDVAYPFEWDNGLIYQVGATRYYENYAISFGYDLNESVQTEQNYNPAVSDADRHWLNIGISDLNSSRPWTLAYQYGWSDRTVSGHIANPLTLETANGSYDTEVHALVISLGFSL